MLAKPKPIPWLPQGAINFLEEYLTKDMNMLEFGAGDSTLWFAERVGYIYSIEYDWKWMVKIERKIRQSGKNNVGLSLIQPPEINSLLDFILVDGGNRVLNFRQALRVLKPGGVIMLDNSERPEYQPCFDMVEGWQQFTDHGEKYKPNWYYENWQTTWWIK